MSTMYYIASTPKSVVDAARDLEAAVEKHKFGVLHVYNLEDTLKHKGFALGAQCRIYEVCNPKHAAEVLGRDMRINMALPCRISIFEDRAKTKIGTILPGEMVRALSSDAELGEMAARVETTIKAIIDDAAAPADARQALLLRRSALAREIDTGVAKRSAEHDGLLATNVPDAGELAAADLALDVGIAEVERDVAEIESIDGAMKRLDSGSYGTCIDCGKAIEPARLTKNPEVARCVPCQRHREHNTGARIARL